MPKKTSALTNSTAPSDNASDNQNLHPLVKLLNWSWEFITNHWVLLLSTLNFSLILQPIKLVLQEDMEEAKEFFLQSLVKWPLRISDNLQDYLHLVRYWIGYEDTYPTFQASIAGINDAWQYAVQQSYMIAFSMLLIYLDRKYGHTFYGESLPGMEKETLVLLTKNFPGTPTITVKPGNLRHQYLVQFPEHDADFFQFLEDELKQLKTPNGLPIFNSIQVTPNNTLDIRYMPTALTNILRFPFIPILYNFFLIYLVYVSYRASLLQNNPSPEFLRLGIHCGYLGYIYMSRNYSLPSFLIPLHANPLPYAKAANLRLLKKLEINREMNFLESIAPKSRNEGYWRVEKEGGIQPVTNLTSGVKNSEPKREMTPIHPEKQAYCYIINISPNLFDSFKILGKENFLLHPQDLKRCLEEYLNRISKENPQSFSIFSDSSQPLVIQIIFHSADHPRLSQTFEQWMLKPTSTLLKLNLPTSEVGSLKTLIAKLQELLKNKDSSEVTHTTVSLRHEQLSLDSANAFRDAVMTLHATNPISLEEWETLTLEVQETLKQLQKKKDALSSRINVLQGAHQTVKSAKPSATLERIKLKHKKADIPQAEPLLPAQEDIDAAGAEWQRKKAGNPAVALEDFLIGEDAEQDDETPKPETVQKNPTPLVARLADPEPAKTPQLKSELQLDDDDLLITLPPKKTDLKPKSDDRSSNKRGKPKASTLSNLSDSSDVNNLEIKKIKLRETLQIINNALQSRSGTLRENPKEKALVEKIWFYGSCGQIILICMILDELKYLNPKLNMEEIFHGKFSGEQFVYHSPILFRHKIVHCLMEVIKNSGDTSRMLTTCIQRSFQRQLPGILKCLELSALSTV